MGKLDIGLENADRQNGVPIEVKIGSQDGKEVHKHRNPGKDLSIQSIWQLMKIKTSVGQFQRLKWQTNMTVRDVEQGSESRCPWGIGRRCWSTRCVVCQIQD